MMKSEIRKKRNVSENVPQQRLRSDTSGAHVFILQTEQASLRKTGNKTRSFFCGRRVFREQELYRFPSGVACLSNSA